MHCPQCGQQQVSDEVRFCKGCGFSLGAVRELLAKGGISQSEEQSHKPRLSPRRNGVRQGAILLFIAMCLLPLHVVLGDRWGQFIPLMFLMAGLMRILYAAIFQEGAPSDTHRRNTLTHPAVNRIDPGGNPDRRLPPSQSVPVTAFQTSGKIREIVSPPSVTEHTTKLLNESDDD